MGLGTVTSPHLPVLLAGTDDGQILVTESLTNYDWHPHDHGLDDLWIAVAEFGPHLGLDLLPLNFQGAGRDTWTTVLADDRFATAVDIDGGWFRRHGIVLAATAQLADTSGDLLVHGDLGPGNWCRSREGLWKFVDWAAARRGNPLVDDAVASVRLTRLRGEPVCSPRLTDHPEIAAFVAGQFAGELLDVDWTSAPTTARTGRAADIRAGTLLTAHLLGLPQPF
jgi:hypothetical protein